MNRSLLEALTRGWLRLPPDVRLAVHPLGGTAKDVVNKRLAASFLAPRLRDKHPELRSVLRAGPDDQRESDQVADAVAGLLPEVRRDGLVLPGLRDARHRAGVTVWRHEETLYRLARQWDGDRPPAPEDCDRAVTRLSGAHDQPPPNHAVLERLLADPDVVGRLITVVDSHWAAHPPAPGRTTGPTDQRAVNELLDSDVTSDLDGLWESYSKTRPWERLLADAEAFGLSATADPPRPGVAERRTGRGTPLPRPLDRSLRQRLGPAVFKKPEDASEEFRDSTTLEVALAEAERMCGPLGLSDDDRRAAFTLGVHLAYAVNTSVIDERLAAPGRSPVHRLPRRMEKLISVIVGEHFLAYNARRPGGLHGRARQKLEDADVQVVPRLWSRLHTGEVRGMPTSPERCFELVNSAIRSFVREVGSDGPAPDEPEVVWLGEWEPRDPAADGPTAAHVPVGDPRVHDAVLSVFDHLVGADPSLADGGAYQLVRWFLTASDTEAVRGWWHQALKAYADSLPDGGRPVVRPTVEQARDVVETFWSDQEEDPET
ncbi:hypothetical protein [Streptomyces sp. NPDC006997]|uniref:hypothetical protein n=1 Tax=Streptomyces sp. NPDC006997 TaxID=3155356 RepID=UPI0034083A70